MMKLKVGQLYSKFKSSWETEWVPAILWYCDSIQKGTPEQPEGINGM